MVFNMGKNKDIELNNDIALRNEIDANKALSNGCIFSAIVVAFVWILYLAGVFAVTPKTLLVISIIFPIIIVLLLSTMIYTRTKAIEKPGFKYFLITQFIVVTFVINIVIPKHGILMWASCIIVVDHYYSPKLTIFTYITVLVSMFISIYLGMLFGEWDANLLNGAYIINVNGVDVNVDNATFKQRVDWIDFLKSVGDNRYLKTFLYYFIPRALIITVIESICIAISKRSLNLLKTESRNAKQNAKMKSELNVAKEIQYSVLPNELDDYNKDNIFGIMMPAKEVGGDFFDYFYIDESHLALVIADVSGKGIPAALFMMKTETLIKSLTMTFKQDTALIMRRSNISLCTNNEANVFVTCWFGILNLNSGELKYTSAGHNKAVIIHNGEAKFLDDKPNVVLGAFNESSYTENSIMLDKGDKILLYTDGVTEAHSQYNKLYGEKRLLDFANRNTNLSTKEFVNELKLSVDEFSEGAEQFDDITILMFNYVMENTIIQSRIFEADVKELNNLFEYSSSLLRILDFSNKDIILINTALEEIFVNVAKYAYDGKGTVEVTLSKSRDFVKFVFKDNGKPFNPLSKEDPNITASSEEREIGGLGIYMVKKIMDEVTYDYVDNQNVLTLVKFKR